MDNCDEKSAIEAKIGQLHRSYHSSRARCVALRAEIRRVVEQIKRLVALASECGLNSDGILKGLEQVNLPDEDARDEGTPGTLEERLDKTYQDFRISFVDRSVDDAQRRIGQPPSCALPLFRESVDRIAQCVEEGGAEEALAALERAVRNAANEEIAWQNQFDRLVSLHTMLSTYMATHTASCKVQGGDDMHYTALDCALARMCFTTDDSRLPSQVVEHPDWRALRATKRLLPDACSDASGFYDLAIPAIRVLIQHADKLRYAPMEASTIDKYNQLLVCTVSLYKKLPASEVMADALRHHVTAQTPFHLSMAQYQDMSYALGNDGASAKQQTSLSPDMRFTALESAIRSQEARRRVMSMFPPRFLLHWLAA
jgi:hypothetical protein